MTRAAMWGLLTVVATAAAVLSFSALSDLALLCGFHERLAWMMPVVVDAGAAAGALIWLGTSSPVRALRFARALTWVLLASSVAGNAVTHYLAAYSLRPAWWLVVIVSAVAPSVLGSVIHLAVLVGRQTGAGATEPPTPKRSEGRSTATGARPASVRDNAPVTAGPSSAQPDSTAKPKRTTVAPTPDDLLSRTRELAPIGRRALTEALGVSEYRARKLLEELDAERAPRNGVKVLEDAR